jgi:SAM-dependent methyltransferase
VLFVRNQRATEAYRFSGIVAFHSERFTRSHARPAEVQFIPASRLRWTVYRGMYHLRQLLLRDGFINAPISVVGGGLLLGLSLVGNLDTLRRTRSGPSRGVASSFIMRLDVDPTPRSPEAALLALTTPAAPPPETPYDRAVELTNAVGSASLGPFTGKIWYENPRDFAVMLARYKFVAQMLNGVRNAGEVGCGDAFGARIVMQEVPDVTVYDADERFIEDIRSRQQPRWPLKALLHDVAETPLPRRHDAIFCLNMVDRIRPDGEYAFLANLCDSLVPNGLLILGVPAVKEVSDGAKPGTTGRLNGNSGKELKEVLEKYFERVLLFSMSGEAVQPGFYPGADYVFVLASIARWNALFDVEGRRFESDPLAGAFRE